MENENLELIAESLLKKADIVSKVKTLSSLAGDASGRRYFRLTLSNEQSFILMCTMDMVGPIVSSRSFINPNDVFFELSPFLRANKYLVPAIYARDGHYLLVEDCGDMPLWHFSLGQLSKAEIKVASEVGADYLEIFYKGCVDLILRLQSISSDQHMLVFKRSLTFNEYYAESKRFITYYLDEKYPNLSSKVDSIIKDLATKVSKHPMALMHRDFMPWNIQIDKDLKLRVIDYQDMLLGSRLYDLVSLLHDRDADFAIGDSFCKNIAEYFFEKSGLENTSEMYHEIVLQRYLRLVGQFYLLTEQFDKPIYQSWIPGCLTRVGKSLAKLPEFSNLAELLSVIPEVRKGLEQPFNF